MLGSASVDSSSLHAGAVQAKTAGHQRQKDGFQENPHWVGKLQDRVRDLLQESLGFLHYLRMGAQALKGPRQQTVPAGLRCCCGD